MKTKRCLSVISKDQEVVDDLRSLLNLVPNWEMRHTGNPDEAWIKYLTEEPDLTIVDVDCMRDRLQDGPGQSDAARTIRSGEISPLLVFISSAAITSLGGQMASELRAMDYIQKPIDLDKIVFALSVAEGPDE